MFQDGCQIKYDRVTCQKNKQTAKHVEQSNFMCIRVVITFDYKSKKVANEQKVAKTDFQIQVSDQAHSCDALFMITNRPHNKNSKNIKNRIGF